MSDKKIVYCVRVNKNFIAFSENYDRHRIYDDNTVTYITRQGSELAAAMNILDLSNFIMDGNAVYCEDRDHRRLVMCVRHRDFADSPGTWRSSLDRVRVFSDRSREHVQVNGKVINYGCNDFAFSTETYIKEGVWVKCEDKNWVAPPEKPKLITSQEWFLRWELLMPKIKLGKCTENMPNLTVSHGVMQITSSVIDDNFNNIGLTVTSPTCEVRYYSRHSGTWQRVTTLSTCEELAEEWAKKIIGRSSSTKFKSSEFPVTNCFDGTLVANIFDNIPSVRIYVGNKCIDFSPTFDGWKKVS